MFWFKSSSFHGRKSWPTCFGSKVAVFALENSDQHVLVATSGQWPLAWDQHVLSCLRWLGGLRTHCLSFQPIVLPPLICNLHCSSLHLQFGSICYMVSIWGPAVSWGKPPGYPHVCVDPAIVWGVAAWINTSLKHFCSRNLLLILLHPFFQYHIAVEDIVDRNIPAEKK